MSSTSSATGLHYFIQTFGCQMNYSDTERVAAVLEQAGYKQAEKMEDVDLFIFNTCSIKQKGEDRVYGIIKNIGLMKRANPRLLIGITGCMVRQTSSRNSLQEQKDDLVKNLQPLDFVFRITDTHKLPEVLAEAEPALELAEELVSEAEGPDLANSAAATAPSSSPSRELPNQESLKRLEYLRVKPTYVSKFQAFVPIQIGCDKYCTYCIVPYSRGREQSRPMAEIVDECRQLVENGCREITLVGQTVNSYGLSDLDKKSGLFKNELPFIQLLHELDALASLGLSRLRYTSPHPRDLSDQLIAAHATLKTLCPYIHLPVQSGDNQVLAKMNRKYTVEQYREKVARLRRAVPNIVITTDIIVGFSGETDEEFQNTARLFQEMRWDQAYISRYSRRQGTVAGKYFPDDVPAKVKAQRWHTINNLLREISLEKNQAYLGRTLEVLVERQDAFTGEFEGRSREMKVVQFPSTTPLVGQLVSVRITQALPWVLKGELV